MSAFRTAEDFTGILFPRIIPPYFLLVQLFLCSAVATTPLFAQQSAPPDEKQFYVNKYAEQLALLQEARFTFSGYFTRSTPSKGMIARWESSGTVRVSAARKSLHCTAAATLAEFPDEPEFAPQDLEVEELLVTPDTFLSISVAKGLDSLDTSTSAERFHVDTKKQIREDEWCHALVHRELGIFLGYAPMDCEGKSLLAISRLAPCDLLRNQILDAKSLSGFLAKPDELEIRALFDPLNHHLLTQMQVSRSIEKPQVDDVTRATMTVLDMHHKDSAPSFIKLKITLERAGGVIPRPDIPGINMVEKSEFIEIEPQTWEYHYDISSIVYHEDAHDGWFTLDHAIPNGSSVSLDGDHNTLYKWRDGKARPIPAKFKNSIDSAAFQRKGSSYRLPMLVAANILLVASLVAVRVIRRRRRDKPEAK